MTWYKKLGFNSNPFSIKPAAFVADVVAYDLDFLMQKIKDSELLFIEGQYGTGKTTILKSIIANFKGRNKIIYYSFNSGVKFDLKSLVDGANSVIRKVTGIKHSNMILLLDEVHTMKPDDSDQIIKYYQDGILQSVVFVSHSYEETQLSSEVKSYLKGNVIKTVPLNQDEVFELIRSRIGDIDLFSKKAIKTIFEHAEKNPRKFLEYCEDVARYAVERDEYRVNDEHIEAVLGIKPQKLTLPEVKVKIEKPKAEVKQVEIKVEKTRVEKPAEKPAVKLAEKPIEKPRLEKPVKEQEIKPERPAVIRAEPKPIIKIEPVKEEPKIEVKPIVELEAEEKEDEEPKRQKKYKINKLVENSKEALGEIQANEEEKNKQASDVPEYKVFAFDN